MKKIKSGKIDMKKVNNILKYVLPFVVAIAVFVVIKFCFMGGAYKLKQIDVKKYEQLVQSKNQSLVYITSDDCAACTEISSLMDRVLQGSKIKTYELNISKLSDDELTTFFDTFDETKEGVVSPTFLLIKDHSIVASLTEPIDEDIFIEFLQNNKIVEK